MTATAYGLREILRRGTRDAHERVDAAGARFDLVNRGDYVRFLRAHAAALLPLEAGLEACGVGRLLPDWRERRRGDALRADLTGLFAAADRQGGTVALSGDDEAWGVLYVLEGSRLGARLLTRAAEQSADAGVRRSTAYFGHGRDRRFWSSFLARLEASGADAAVALAGARRAFARFEQAFERSCATGSAAA